MLYYRAIYYGKSLLEKNFFIPPKAGLNQYTKAGGIPPDDGKLPKDRLYCNVREFAAGSFADAYNDAPPGVPGTEVLPSSAGVWAFRPSADGSVRPVIGPDKRVVEPGINDLANPGQWHSAKIVRSTDCMTGTDKCIGIRWKDGGNNMFYTTPRWISPSPRKPFLYEDVNQPKSATIIDKYLRPYLERVLPPGKSFTEEQMKPENFTNVGPHGRADEAGELYERRSSLRKGAEKASRRRTWRT